MRYLRHKKDGFIYGWHPILAANELCEEISEQEAFPERFVPPHVTLDVVKAKQRKGALDLSTASIPEPPVYTPPELAADASRRLPK